MYEAQSKRIHNLAILVFLFGSPREKYHLDVSPWGDTNYTLGRRMMVPKSKLWCVLWVSINSWLVCAPFWIQTTSNTFFLFCGLTWLCALLKRNSKFHPKLPHPLSPWELWNIPWVCTILQNHESTQFFIPNIIWLN